MQLYDRLRRALTDSQFVDTVEEMLEEFEAGECRRAAEHAHGRENAIRRDLAAFGYSIMHRRNGQYWLVAKEPVTLDELEGRLRQGAVPSLRQDNDDLRLVRGTETAAASSVPLSAEEETRIRDLIGRIRSRPKTYAKP